MSRFIKSRAYFVRCIGFVLLFGFVALGSIVGCNNDDDGGDDLAILLGEQRQEVSDNIAAAFNVSEGFDGELNNMIIDGQNLDKLTDEEKKAIKDAYLQGFIIIVYDITERQIEELYQIVDHKSKYDDGAVLSSLDEGDDGEMYEVYTFESDEGVNWASLVRIGNLEEVESVGGGFEPGTGLGDEESKFPFYAFHMKQWIEQQKDRVQELVDDGVIGANATNVINKFGLADEIEETLQTVTRSDQSGTLLDLTSADIQTNYVYTGFSSSGNIGVSVASASEVNTYQFTSEAWIITADTATGIFSFLFVNDDYTLASSNGFTKNKEGSAAFSNAQQYWYLSSLTSVNTLAVGSTTLDNTKADLLDNEPGTNQASSESVTTSIETSISGTVGVDQDGANASVSGGVSWGTSETYTKANVSINNKSLSEAAPNVSDASWNYKPAAAEPGGQKSTCNDLGLRGLACLSHETFTPSQAFVYRISPNFVGETLKLKTEISFQMRNTYTSGCNIFGCSCGKTDQNSDAGGPWTFTHSIAIPEPPEGPVGDATCSDGIDNDNDGFTDSADSECQT